jgi:hypothetical protein
MGQEIGRELLAFKFKLPNSGSAVGTMSSKKLLIKLRTSCEQALNKLFYLME